MTVKRHGDLYLHFQGEAVALLEEAARAPGQTKEYCTARALAYATLAGAEAQLMAARIIRSKAAEVVSARART